MRCTVCGLDYGMTHNCPGPTSAAQEAALPLPPPTDVRLAPLQYVRLGWEVATLQERAILRASRDNNCFIYGLFFFIAAFLVIFASQLFFGPPVNEHPAVLLIGLFLVMNGLLLWQITFFAICHWIVKLSFGGKGTFAAVLRPVAITSFLMVLTVISVVGPFVSGVWWTVAVVAIVFEQIHEIDKRQAIFTVIGVNLVSNLLQRFFGLGF